MGFGLSGKEALVVVETVFVEMIVSFFLLVSLNQIIPFGITKINQYISILIYCNIRPEDTYRRITKLSLKTTG